MYGWVNFDHGLQLRPLAGIGNSACKTKAKIAQLSGNQISVAFATGASMTKEQPATEPLECLHLSQLEGMRTVL